MSDPHISEDEAFKFVEAYWGTSREVAYEALTALLDHHTQSVLDELEARLLQYNGAYIGIDGKRVNNMVHHDVVREAIHTMKEGEKLGGLEKPKGGVK